jgi:hypothetical protein
MTRTVYATGNRQSRAACARRESITAGIPASVRFLHFLYVLLPFSPEARHPSVPANIMSICDADPAQPDVLIHRDAAGRFTIGPLYGVPQMDCVDFEQALYTAGRFAAREGSNVWYASTVDPPRRLADVFTIRRLWNEYIDLPALRLTRDQIRRMLDVDSQTTDAVVTALVEVGLLDGSRDGAYARATDRHTPIPGLRMKRPALHHCR